MSTSIAALPAYKSFKSTRTKARADRTIFGTTLDTSGKVYKLLNNSGVQEEAQNLFEKRHKKWKTPTPRTQSLRQSAWGLKDFTQPEIGEEHARGYSRLSTYSDVSSCAVDVESVSDVENIQTSDEQVKAEEQSNKPTQLWAQKNKYGVFMVSTENINPWNNLRPTNPPHLVPRSERAASAFGNLGGQKHQLTISDRRRPKTTMSIDRSSSGVASKLSRKSSAGSRGMKTQVPKFHLPPSARDFMRTSSLKITETGAKDLINAGSINKLGLGETSQYNHEWFRRQDTPQIANPYRDHGNVFLLGQRFYGDTTNKGVRGPGGFYQMSTPERTFNERYKGSEDQKTVYSMPYEPSISSRRTFDAAKHKKPRKHRQTKESVPTPNTLEDIIPANIIHKFGTEQVRSLLQGKEKEVKMALQRADKSDLSHTGMVPPRVEVPELNHPIDPPPTYYSNYGQNLKYDKFEDKHGIEV